MSHLAHARRARAVRTRAAGALLTGALAGGALVACGAPRAPQAAPQPAAQPPATAPAPTTPPVAALPPAPAARRQPPRRRRGGADERRAGTAARAAHRRPAAGGRVARRAPDRADAAEVTSAPGAPFTLGERTAIVVPSGDTAAARIGRMMGAMFRPATALALPVQAADGPIPRARSPCASTATRRSARRATRSP
jgi:hypothetical protein